jgi:toxin-antitoxin system PIN domain toxin
MSASLLDVNVLVALFWPAHQHHRRAQAWFVKSGAAGWATCAATQAGFVRTVSNPAATPEAVSPAEALELLSYNLRHPAHEFWPMDLGLAEGVARSGLRVVGHRQIADAYLLGLAAARKSRLVTFDRGLGEAPKHLVTLLVQAGRGGMDVQ